MKKICFLNLKGGCGKTTSVINIGSYLSLEGKKILLVDCDVQSNLTNSFLDYDINRNCIFHLFTYNMDIKDAIYKANDNIDLIPSSLLMATVDAYIYDIQDNHNIIAKSIKTVENNYDYIIFDCPPSFSMVTTNILLSSDEVYVPVQTEYYSVDGIYLMMKVMEILNEKYNSNIEINYIFATLFDSRNSICNLQYENLKNNFDDKFMDTKIRKNVSLAESPIFKESIFDYKPKSNGAIDYKDLIIEIMRKGGL